jgi:hypothetical protein
MRKAAKPNEPHRQASFMVSADPRFGPLVYQALISAVRELVSRQKTSCIFIAGYLP